MALVAWFTAGYVMDVLLRVEPFSGYLGEVSVASQVIGLSIAGLLLALALVVCLAYVSWFVSSCSAALTGSGRRASARAVPAPSARTKQGANRMTGLTTRDSAQRRQIASIGRMRVLTYSTTRPLAPQPPTGCYSSASCSSLIH